MSLQNFKRLAGPALTVGGLLWIALYVVVVIIGSETGKLVGSPDAHPPLLAQIGIWFLPVSILALCLGLLSIFTRLEGRARGLGITGVMFISLGVIMALVNLILLSGVTGNLPVPSSMTGGFGAMATTVGSAFLGGALLRSRQRPRWMAWVLIIIGLVTIPVLFATPLPVGPNWATDFLAFLLSGTAYTILGTRMPTIQQSEVSNAMNTPPA